MITCDSCGEHIGDAGVLVDFRGRKVLWCLKHYVEFYDDEESTKLFSWGIGDDETPRESQMDLARFYGSLIDYLIRKGLTTKELVFTLKAVELSRRWAEEAEG